MTNTTSPRFSFRRPVSLASALARRTRPVPSALVRNLAAEARPTRTD